MADLKHIEVKKVANKKTRVQINVAQPDQVTQILGLDAIVMPDDAID